MPVSHLTSSRAELLAALLNVLDEEANASALTMTEAELLAAIRNTYGGSVSALTTSYGGLLASIENAAGGSGNALTESHAQMLAGFLTARGGSGSNLTLSEAELLAGIANIPAEGGGETEWVPENAVIHIDLVGGSPQGRAWVAGTGIVAVNTLLGTDANTDAWWGPTQYDPANLEAGGYARSTGGSGDNLAFIGAARAKILAGATIVVSFEFESNAFVCGVNASTGVAAVQVQFSTDGLETITAVSDPLGGPDPLGGDVQGAKIIAMTLSPTKVASSINGGTVISNVIDATVWPTSGADQVVAAFLDGGQVQPTASITIYDQVADAALVTLSTP